MDYATICRCCMSQQSTKQLNFTYKNSDGEFENYSDDLLECFNIWVTETELPSHICNSCIQKLRDALDFKKMVLNSDEEFQRLIEQGVVPCTVPSRVADNYDDDDDDMNDETESIHVAAKQNDDEKNVPNILLTTVKVKQEVVQETADDDNEMTDIQDYSTNDGSENVLENKNTIEVPVKFESPPAGPAVAPPMGPSLHFLFMSTTVKPFRWSYGVFQCFYCKASSTDYIRIRTHVDTHKCSTEEITTLTNSGLPIKLDITNITCNVCRKPYETLAELIKHLNGKHSLGFDYDGVTLEEYKVVHLKCHLCVNSFGDFNSLHAHVLQTHKFICPECQRVFYNKQFLFNHMTQFHKVVFCTPSFKCKLCKIKFQTKDLLDAHFESLHLTPSLTGYKVLPTNEQGYMQCPVCHNKFSSDKNLQIHIDKFHVQCKSCSRLFDCSTTLERHLAEAHGDGATESEDPDSDEMEFAEPDSSKSNRNSSKTGSRSLRRRLKANVATLLNMSSALPFTFRYTKFLCFYCKDPFPDPESLTSHTTENHPVWDADIVNLSAANFRLKLNVYNLRCKLCEEQPADIDKLLAHLTSLHGVSFEPGLRPCLVPFRLAPGKMECVHCPGLEFQYFNLLHQHFNSMHGQENEVCDHCGKCFDTIGLLNGHILTYHTEGKYVCKICSEDCVNWHKLRNHLAMVHGEETEACKICGEKFQTLYLKQKHMMTAHNSGHKCPHCDRVFHLRSFMNNHIRRTHLKEKNVPCHVCGKRFFNKLTLSGHMVTHDASLQRLYHCEHCEKGFTKKKYLRLHISRHHAQ